MMSERRVLVDDDTELTDLIETYLGSVHELSVTSASSVEAAIAERGEQRFDCIESDLQMSAASGLDFLKIVRKSEPDMPFLLFTGHGSEAVASEAVEHDVTGYVQKSHDPRQFEELSRQIWMAVGTP